MMKRWNLKSFSWVLPVGLVLFGCARQADAAATIRFVYDGGAIVQNCTDGAVCDLNVTPGVVLFNTTIGVFSINIATGISKPVFDEPQMDLNSVDVRSAGGAHTLEILFSDDFFSVASPGFNLNFGGTLSGNSGSTIKANAWFDNGNTLFAKTTAIGQIGPFGPGAFSGTTSGPGTADTSYSLTQALLLTTAAGLGTTFSGDFELTGVPEPASVALFGGIMLGTISLIRRKAKRA